MSQAEELLNSVSEEIPVHSHPVPDTDAYFVIDPITKQIENTNRKNTVIMQYTHNSERLTFELPRYIDGHDMLECTSVTVNADNVEAVESDGVEEVEPRVNPDAPDITDLRIHPNDPEKAICSWLISRNSTQLAGILSFHIEFKCVDSNGNVVYEWSTDNYDEIEVRARKKNGEAAVVEHTDLLEQWRTRIFGAGDSVMANITAEGEAQVAAVKAESKTQQDAVELKGAQTLESIPEDYTEVDAMADKAVRTKSDAIVCEAAGESIVLKDSSNDHIRGLKLFGKSTQASTPSPDNPQEITSIENPTTRIFGKNLLPKSATNETYAGLTIVVNDDQSITVNGTATDVVYYAPFRFTFKSGMSYVVSGCPTGGSNDTYFMYVNNLGGVRDYGDGALVRLDNDFTSDVGFCIRSGSVINNLTFYPMVRMANTQSGYEESNIQSINSKYALPGIPVTSDGNYTDENGQQWICDEVDLERGVYVQRVKRITLDDNVYWWAYENDGISGDGYCYVLTLDDAALGANVSMCTHFVNSIAAWDYRSAGHYSDHRNVPNKYFISDIPTLEQFKSWLSAQRDTNPVELIYVLATPVETPLTAEEIAAFKALRTNYPNTTILNDAGAWMSVKYNADTKSYVDQPKTLKLVDTSTGVVYELKVVDGNLTVVPV